MRDIAIVDLARPAGRAASPPRFVVLLNARAKDLDRQFKLIPEQSKTIDKAIADYRTEVDARPIISRDKLAKAVGAVLTTEQDKRLAQLLQLQAAANLHNTLNAPEMVKKLELTDKQIDKLTDLKEDAQKLYALLTAEKLAENQDLSLRVKDTAMEMMFVLYTYAQKDIWKTLTGKPWKELTKRPPVQPKQLNRPLSVGNCFLSRGHDLNWTLCYHHLPVSVAHVENSFYPCAASVIHHGADPGHFQMENDQSKQTTSGMDGNPQVRLETGWDFPSRFFRAQL